MGPGIKFQDKIINIPYDVIVEDFYYLGAEIAIMVVKNINV